jgi:hypothetical protein
MPSSVVEDENDAVRAPRPDGLAEVGQQLFEELLKSIMSAAANARTRRPQCGMRREAQRNLGSRRHARET